jgi:signal peptidase I
MPSNDTYSVAAEYTHDQKGGKSPAPVPSDDGKALLAMSGAMLWPGVGHWLTGSIIAGSIWCFLWTAILAAFVAMLALPQYLAGLIVLVPLAALVQIAQVFHAVRRAKRTEFPMLPNPLARYAVAGALLVLAGILQLSLVHYIQNNWLEVCWQPSDSMAPALIPGDWFLELRNQPLQRWDIASFTAPPRTDRIYENYCKRVVGLPGEKIEITASALLINGRPAKLPPHVGPYIPVDTSLQTLNDSSPLRAGNGCWGNPIILGSDEYYVLGDNSPISDDARVWPPYGSHTPGALPADQIAGKIVCILWPPSRWTIFSNPQP